MARYDAGPLARGGGATPSWHMLTFGYAVAARDADWRGLVAIDREGEQRRLRDERRRG